MCGFDCSPNPAAISVVVIPRYPAACIFVVKIFIYIVNRDTRGTMADYYVTRAAPSHTMNVCRTWRHFRSNKHTYKIVKHSKNVIEITLKSQANIWTASFDNILSFPTASKASCAETSLLYLSFATHQDSFNSNTTPEINEANGNWPASAALCGLRRAQRE